MDENGNIRPKRFEMLSREVLDELLIYDHITYRGHCLNQAAALVWKACNGESTVPEITRALQQVDPGMDEQVVYFALGKLKKAGLLADESVPETAKVSRRDLVRRAGGIALIAIPVVTSMLMPTPARAASCFQLGHPCAINAQCCSGLCAAVIGIGIVCT
jgi:hypothetical protein